jgi:hypothetical protein
MRKSAASILCLESKAFELSYLKQIYLEAHKVPLPLDLVALAAAARNNSDVVGQSAGC